MFCLAKPGGDGAPPLQSKPQPNEFPTPNLQLAIQQQAPTTDQARGVQPLSLEHLEMRRVEP